MPHRAAPTSSVEPYRPAEGAGSSWADSSRTLGAGSSVPSRPSAARHRGDSLAAVVLVATALLAGGCGFTQSPGAELGAATLVDRSAEALRFDVSARLANPNREDSLELRTVEYTVRLKDVGTFRGLRAAQVTLAPRSESEFRLPVVVPVDRLPAGARELAWSLDARLLYIAPGALAETLLDAGVRRPTLRFSGRGTVAIGADAAPPPAFPDAAVD